MINKMTLITEIWPVRFFLLLIVCRRLLYCQRTNHMLDDEDVTRTPLLLAFEHSRSTLSM